MYVTIIITRTQFGNVVRSIIENHYSVMENVYMQSSTHVKSIEKAIRLLGQLAKAGQPLTLKALSEAEQMPKSTVHGLLAPLRAGGLVEQTQDGQYKLGIRLFELGCAVKSSWRMIDAAAPHLKNISLQTGQSVQLSTLDNGEVLMLDSQDSGSALRIVAQAGGRMPAHCTASGKAMLAYLTPAHARSIIKNSDMTSFTPHTLQRGDMEAEFERIRQNGYAIENGEYRIGLRAVAAPIFDMDGLPTYAICVTGMFRHITSDEFQRATTLVVEAARALNERG